MHLSLLPKPAAQVDLDWGSLGDCLGTAAVDICKNLNTCLVQDLATMFDRCSLQHPKTAVVSKSL